MAERNILKLIEKSEIGNDLKVAYKLMLLARGYSDDELKILDDYDFFVRKKEIDEATNADSINENALKFRKKNKKPINLVCLTSTSEIYNRRDHTLYSLNDNEPATKGILVLSIISLYQKEFNPTYKEISQLFNNKLNLGKNTVIDEATLDTLRPDKQKRYYYHESDYIMSFDGVRYAVSNQWSKDKMDEIIAFAKSVGYKVEMIESRNR